MKFEGNWATLLVPWNADGSIDIKALEEEIYILISAKVNGIYSCGTAGEFHLLSEQEFWTINEMLSAICLAEGQLFQIGASHSNPHEVLTRLERIANLQPNGIQIIAPDWWKTKPEILIKILARFSEEISHRIPFILYNPPHAKYVYSPEELCSIALETNSLRGIKVLGGDQDWFTRMNPLLQREDFSIFIPGHTLASGLKMGADGAYSNMCCLNPFTAQNWYKQILAEDWETALDLERRIARFMKSNIVPLIDRGIPNYIIDRVMSVIGAWGPLTARAKWPYESLQQEEIALIGVEAKKIIPEFFR